MARWRSFGLIVGFILSAGMAPPVAAQDVGVPGSTEQLRRMAERLLREGLLRGRGVAGVAAGGVSKAGAVPSGGDIFLSSDLVELALNNNGAIGSLEPLPGGFHSGGLPGLGAVADYGRDGWGVGTPPQTWDFVLIEGWAVGWGGSYLENDASPFFGGFGTFPTSAFVDTSQAGTSSAEWSGRGTGGPGEALSVTQAYRLGANSGYLVADVTLTNTGAAPLVDLRYSRIVLPIPDWPTTPETLQFVRYQPGVAGWADRALVVARAPSYPATIGLGTIDARATVFPAASPDPPESAPQLTVGPMLLEYATGTLAPGESTRLSFTYCFIYEQLEAALQATVPCRPAWVRLQPEDQTITYGQAASLSSLGVGSGPIFYQWYVGSSGDMSRPIEGATANTYTTDVLEDTTSFWVHVWNACGDDNSRTVKVTVEFPAYAPLDFRVERLENDLQFFKEDVNRLRWVFNPKNKKAIVKQRLFRKAKDAPDSTFELVKELAPDVFDYNDRALPKGKAFTYRLAVLNEKGWESEPSQAGN